MLHFLVFYVRLEKWNEEVTVEDKNNEYNIDRLI